MPRSKSLKKRNLRSITEESIICRKQDSIPKQQPLTEFVQRLSLKSLKICGSEKKKKLDYDVSKFREIFKEFKAQYVPYDVPMESLVSEYCKLETMDQEAFYIVDLSRVVRQYLQFKKYLPRVTPFYAVKCNPSNVILKTLQHLGVNFDCASKGEIEQVIELGADPTKQIIFANPCKQLSHIRFANEKGVSMVTLDNEAELYKMRSHWPNVGIIIRIAVDDSKSICKFSSKYGAHMDQVPRLIQVAKELGLNLIGVSFHVGSGCYSADSFTNALKNARSVFDLTEKAGYNLTVLDIGGGFPGSNDDKPSFVDIAEAIRGLMDELFPKNVQIIAEPGRYFASASHTMVCNIFSKRQNKVEEGKDQPEFLYYINDGLYGSFNCLYFDHAKIEVKTITSNQSSTKKHLCTIFGPTCDSLDKIAENIYMPELEIGDWIYVPDFGAYTVAAASSFNGFKTAKMHYIWTN